MLGKIRSYITKFWGCLMVCFFAQVHHDLVVGRGRSAHHPKARARRIFGHRLLSRAERRRLPRRSHPGKRHHAWRQTQCSIHAGNCLSTAKGFSIIKAKNIWKTNSNLNSNALSTRSTLRFLYKSHLIRITLSNCQFLCCEKLFLHIKS